jgi:hypothetical protein
VQQPVIQFGAAVNGKSFSGGILNRGQKLLRFAHSLSVPRVKRVNEFSEMACCSKGILANRAVVPGVAVVTAPGLASYLGYLAMNFW